ncbi:MAG: YbaB/EbfC family nucleoid-associated protein [Planctomycetota bacterium]|nr:YbaB/EbfC family nucleoid-associated protein [Planctomycetota bacterium]MEE2882491.1 YbaB/EbfC family nucleoid-associated protein [Planctomycetota bacterium]
MSTGDLGGLFQQAQKMQKELKAVQEDLKQRTVVGESGSGLVKVYANGQQEVMKIEIDPSAIDPDDADLLEDLVLVAVQQALEKAKELSDQETSRVTGGMSFPGMS